MHAVSTNQITDILHFNDKAKYFERRICLKSTQLKQTKTKSIKPNLLKTLYTYKTSSIQLSLPYGFVFKGSSHRKLKFKICPKFGYHGQHLILWQHLMVL